MPFDKNGLVIPRQVDLVTDIVTEEKLKIHPQINTDPDTLLGQLNTVLSDSLSTAYEHLQYANSQLKVNEAEGKGLEEIGLVKGVSRLLASKSQVYLAFTGSPTVQVLAGSLYQDPNTKAKYYLLNNVVIDLDSCISFKFTPYTVTSGAVWSTTIDGITYNRTLPGGSFSLVTEVTNYVAQFTSAGYIASFTQPEPIAQPTRYDITVSKVDQTVPMAVAFTAGTLFWLSATSTGLSESVDKGVSTVATPGNWTLLTPNSSIYTVSPVIATLNPGRDLETDESLRFRIRQTATAVGKGTTRAVKSNLLNTSGVKYVSVAENKTAATVSGLPPYTIHCVVEGGTDAAVSKTIWDTVGSCTPLFGTTTFSHTDDFNEPQVVKFSRPSSLFIDVEVTWSVYDEETLSTNVTTKIRNAVADYINSLGLGADIIPSRIFGPIYDAVTGINVTLIRVREHATGSYQTTKLTVASTQFPTIVADGSYIPVIQV